MQLYGQKVNVHGSDRLYVHVLLVGQKRRTFTAAEKDLECQGWVIMASFGSHHEVCPVSIYHTGETGAEGGGGK